MEVLGHLLNGVWLALHPPVVTWLLIGTAIGLVIGVLPAIGATAGVVLFLPMTYGMDISTAVVFLMAIYATGQYGDSVASILINTPGGPGTVASCWEGYPMTRRGEGARALGIATLGSMIGGLAGSIGLVLLAWPLTNLAMTIGPPEYFALGVMALGLVSIASRGETLKGLIMGCFGLALSFVGQDPVSGLVERFAFGSIYLAAGIPTISLIVGIFAISQIIRMLQEGGSIVQEANISVSFSVRDVLIGFRDVVSYPLTLIRSIFFGLYIGILPALGVASATAVSYLVEKKYSKESEKFGQGVPSGLVAVEVSKGCCVVGDMIPTFTLGIPGSATGAIIMAAFILHGVQPGPEFLLAGPVPYIVFAGIILSQFLIVLIGLPLIKYFASVAKIPNALLAPVVVVLCFVGTLVERNMAFDIFFLLLCGVLGYVIDEFGYSSISLLIGFILGPLVETNLHRTISMGFGSYHLLWTRPLTVAFLIFTFLFLGWPYLKEAFLMIRRGKTPKRLEVTGANSDTSPISMGEIIWLSIPTIMALIMLIESRSYPPNVGLFSNGTCYFMLALIAWRIASLIHAKGLCFNRIPWRKPWVSLGAMSWEWSVATMMGYFLLIYGVGFLIATAIYLVAVPFLLRYKKKYLIVLIAGAVTVGIWEFARFLKVVLPSPF